MTLLLRRICSLCPPAYTLSVVALGLVNSRRRILIHVQFTHNVLRTPLPTMVTNLPD